MNVHAHPVTLVCRGHVDEIWGEEVYVRIGLCRWHIRLPKDYVQRPEVGLYIQALLVPQGGVSPDMSSVPVIAGWSKVRPPTKKIGLIETNSVVGDGPRYTFP